MADAPRLAVLPTVSDFTSFADLLTAALSGRDQVILLEREQIQKVLREHELAAGQRRDYVKLGHLIQADGLILLERRVSGGRELLATRMVAVNPGVVVTEHLFNLPLENTAEWGTDCAKQLERVLPKLTVRTNEAIPISVLNLRSSISTKDASVLEQECTTALQSRLAREPAVFLLERRRMEQLEVEKQLRLADMEPFWNGTFVIDGTINREVVSTQAVSIHIRLSRPREASVDLEASGRREALGTVVNELAEKILAVLKKTPTAAPWEPALEAEAFLRESEWAFRWKLWRPSFEAADASSALGLRTRSVAAFRVVSRAWLAFSMRGPLDYQSVGGPYGFRPPPDPEALPILIRALEIYDESFQQFARETNGPGIAWATVGVDVLRAAARLLERYHARVDFRYGQEEDLRRLRALAQRINDQLTRHLGLGLANWSRNLGNLPRFDGWKANSSVTLGESWLEAGGVWFENPADAIAHCRLLLVETKAYRQVRQKLLSDPPPIPSWSYKDRKEWLNLWLDFAREMAASTNVQVHFDGMRLLLRDSLDPVELETVARKFSEESSVAQPPRFNGGVDAPVGEVMQQLVRRVAPWNRSAVELPGGRTSEQWKQESVNTMADETYHLWKKFLTQFTNKTNKTFTFMCPAIPPRPEQLSELIAEFETVEREKRGRGPVKVYIEMLKGYTNKAVNQQSLLRSTFTPTSPQASRQTEVNHLPNQAVPLPVSRCWSLTQLDLPSGRTFGQDPCVRNMIWHQDRLWLETSLYQVQNTRTEVRFAWIALTPDDMQATFVEAPWSDIARHLVVPRKSMLLDNELYACTEGALWRRNAQGQWQQWTIPATGPATPYAWGKQVVLSTEHSILEFNPQTAQTRVLASTRRNPPVTALDRARRFGHFEDTFWPAPLAIWPDNKLRALVEGKIWTYDPARQDWTPLYTISTNREELMNLTSEGVFYRFADRDRMGFRDGMAMLGGWRPGATTLEFYTWEPRPGPTGLPVPAGQFTPPLWSHPKASQPHDSHAVFDGPNIWIFPAPAGLSYATLRTTDDHEKKEVIFTDPNLPSSVLFLDRRYRRALEMRLELTEGAHEHAEAYEQARKTYGRWLEFLPTPAGLAILIGKGGILLWIPKVNVDRAVAEARRSNSQAEHWDYAGFMRFDRDQNGWLDDQERRAMRRDAAWQKEEQTALKAAMQAAIKRDGARWEAIFTSADKNQDRKLSSGELAAAITAHPQGFVERMRGVNGSVLFAIPPFDLDQDLALDLAEFRSFMAEPRLVAEVNRSVGWLSQFGLKPEQCDTNDDGFIDDRERLNTNRLLRERGGIPVGKKRWYYFW